VEITNNRVNNWPLDYVHTNFGGGQLNNHREMLVQIGLSRSSVGTPAMLLTACAVGRKIRNPKETY